MFVCCWVRRRLGRPAKGGGGEPEARCPLGLTYLKGLGHGRVAPSPTFLKVWQASLVPPLAEAPAAQRTCTCMCMEQLVAGAKSPQELASVAGRLTLHRPQQHPLQ